MSGVHAGAARPPRGAAAVCRLRELPPCEAASILYMRKWCMGGAHRDEVRADFSMYLGGPRGAYAADMLDELLRVVAHGGRRPLMRHGLACGCVGGDEAAFAQLVASAAEGDREDALLIASLLVRGEMSFQALALAEEFGGALSLLTPLMARSVTAKPPPARSAATLH